MIKNFNQFINESNFILDPYKAGKQIEELLNRYNLTYTSEYYDLDYPSEEDPVVKFELNDKDGKTAFIYVWFIDTWEENDEKVKNIQVDVTGSFFGLDEDEHEKIYSTNELEHLLVNHVDTEDWILKLNEELTIDDFKGKFPCGEDPDIPSKPAMEMIEKLLDLLGLDYDNYYNWGGNEWVINIRKPKVFRFKLVEYIDFNTEKVFCRIIGNMEDIIHSEHSEIDTFEELIDWLLEKFDLKTDTWIVSMNEDYEDLSMDDFSGKFPTNTNDDYPSTPTMILIGKLLKKFGMEYKYQYYPPQNKWNVTITKPRKVHFQILEYPHLDKSLCNIEVFGDSLLHTFEDFIEWLMGRFNLKTDTWVVSMNESNEFTGKFEFNPKGSVMDNECELISNVRKMLDDMGIYYQYNDNVCYEIILERFKNDLYVDKKWMTRKERFPQGDLYPGYINSSDDREIFTLSGYYKPPNYRSALGEVEIPNGLIALRVMKEGRAQKIIRTYEELREYLLKFYTDKSTSDHIINLNENNNNCDFWENKFNVSPYDDVFRLPLYYYVAKKMEGRIEYMSPDEFMERAANHGSSYQDNVDIVNMATDHVKSLADKMKNGTKIDLPFIMKIGEETIGHEGRHRAWAAKSLGCNLMPVGVFKFISDEEVLKFLEENKDKSKEELNKFFIERGYPKPISGLGMREFKNRLRWQLNEKMSEDKILRNPNVSFDKKEDQIIRLRIDDINDYKKFKSKLESMFGNLDKDVDYTTVSKLTKENSFLKQYVMLLSKKREVELLDLQIEQKEETLENLKKEIDGADGDQRRETQNQIRETEEEISNMKNKREDYSDVEAMIQKWDTHIIRTTRDLKNGKSVLSSTLSYLR